MFYVYRKSSGEVLGVSVSSYGTLPSEFGEFNTPTVVQLSQSSHIISGNNIRAATQAEKNNFQDAERNDKISAEKTNIKDLFDSAQPGSVLIKAVIKTILDEVNLIRAAAGQPARTAAQVRAALRNNIDTAS